MTHVATLISSPDASIIQEEHLQAVAALLPEAGLPIWLEQGVAADIVFRPEGAIDLKALWQDIRIALQLAPIDIVLQPLDGRRKKLLLADMDATIIRQECIDELAGEIGKKDEVAAITARVTSGELEFEPALRQRVALFRGMSVDAIARTLDERIEVTPGARVLVQTMRAQGAYTILATGGFSAFAEVISEKVGFDAFQSNRLKLTDNRLTGELDEPIHGKDAKRSLLIRLRDKDHLPPEETMAVGDSEIDIGMLTEAGLGVAFRAKPNAAAAAHARIDHGDLTALLYLQGYNPSEFQG